MIRDRRIYRVRVRQNFPGWQARALTTARSSTPDVITVRADTTVGEITRLLTEQRINAAPVMDDEFSVSDADAETQTRRPSGAARVDTGRNRFAP
jgi:CBS-domain-containing membrane protein